MLTLTQLSHYTGVSRRTLQEYDAMGLLTHREKTAGGYWLYAEKDAERLQLIQLLRHNGYTRKEILTILPEPDLPLEEMLLRIRTSLIQRREQIDLLLALLEPAHFRQVIPMPDDSDGIPS